MQLSGDGAIGSPGGTHPLAFDKTAYATWVQNGVIHLSTSDDGGVTWGDATRVTAHNTALYPCSLELSGPVLHLVWPDTRNHGLAEPYYKRSADGGRTWLPAERLRGFPGEWAVNGVAGNESRVIALLSRGDTIHVSVRQSQTTKSPQRRRR